MTEYFTAGEAGGLECGEGRYVITEEVPPGWVLDVNCVSLESTFEYLPGQGVAITYVDGDTVDCTFTNSPAGPVGGVVTPANNFAVVARWLAVIGLVACIGTLVGVVARKRRA